MDYLQCHGVVLKYRLLASAITFLGLLWPVCSTGKPIPHLKVKTPQIALYRVSAVSFSEKELRCLAMNIYHEARGEGFTGMVGVAQVTLNRHHVRYRGKSTLCQIIFDRGQFSWTRKPKHIIQSKAWNKAQQVATQVAEGLRIRGLENALYFHKHNRTPRWSKKTVVVMSIGRHHYRAAPT